MVKLHKDYDPNEFTYDNITKAWAVTNGAIGRYFFIAHLVSQPFCGGGNWMAYLRRPDKTDWTYVDVPFDSNKGFLEEGEAEDAVYKRAYQDLGLRIEEIETQSLPSEIDSDTKGLLVFINQKT
ncbi:MAG: hypothetical protein Q8N99_00870 [Nanoarchaeota archaeon]|nr:hypothetical protein [Nanoarchaeota archaeon]